MTEGDNASAEDLWRQVFKRLSASEYASLLDPEHDAARDAGAFWEAMKEAGWSDEETDLRVKAHEEQLREAPTTSPGVNPHVEAWFARLADDVETAMGRLGMTSQAHVARGIEPRCGPLAAKINVVMTNQSVVTVGTHLFRFCGLIARAFTRTLILNPAFWESERWDKEAARALLRGSPSLLVYWMRIFVSYATTGTHILVPFRPAQKHEVLLFEQVARAMELFAIAHEYGHHEKDHGRTIGADAHAEEFAADQFALRIGYEVDRYPLILPNPYLASGAGGVVLLTALRCLAGVDAILRGRPRHVSDTHPDADERVARFDTVSVLQPAEFKTLKGFRVASDRIMRTVEQEMLDVLGSVPREELAAFAPLPFDAD